MKKMKLQGTNSKKIPKEKKEKMDKTLEDMTDVRNTDNVRLRLIIQKQIDYLNEQHANAIKVINTLNKQLKDVTEKAIKIEGALLGLTRVLSIADGKEIKKNG